MVFFNIRKLKIMTGDNVSYNIYYKELMKVKIFNQKVLKNYLKAYKKFGDRYALKKICDSNYRYVEHLAYQRLTSDFNILDLINEGNIGLLEAIEAFDLSRNNTFLSFAHARIDKRIRMFIDTYSTKVHIPYNIVISSKKVKKFIEKYKKEHRDNPRIEVIAENLGISVKEVKKDLNYINDIKSNKYIDTEFTISQENINNSLEEYLNLLEPEYREFITKAYGLFGEYSVSHEDLAEMYNITVEDVKERINKIIKLLKKIK